MHRAVKIVAGITLAAVVNVYVAENVALYRPAVHSSQYMEAYATNAVDGSSSDPHHCACTVVGYDSWWAVDLGSQVDVAHVCVTNDFHTGHGQIT